MYFLFLITVLSAMDLYPEKHYFTSNTLLPKTTSSRKGSIWVKTLTEHFQLIDYFPST